LNCQMSTSPHSLDNGLTYGSEVVSLTRRPHALYPPGRFLVLIGHSAAGRIRSIENSNDLIGNRTRDLPACSTVPSANYAKVNEPG
jgi:hypothetical protein